MPVYDSLSIETLNSYYQEYDCITTQNVRIIPEVSLMTQITLINMGTGWLEEESEQYNSRLFISDRVELC